MATRSGRQMQPASFTRYLEVSDEHGRYALIPTNKFTIPEGFSERVEKAIVKRKRNKAVGEDGIHIEMAKAEPAACATILTEW